MGFGFADRERDEVRRDDVVGAKHWTEPTLIRLYTAKLFIAFINMLE